MSALTIGYFKPQHKKQFQKTKKSVGSDLTAGGGEFPLLFRRPEHWRRISERSGECLVCDMKCIDARVDAVSRYAAMDGTHHQGS